jgi:hypothetical protein
MYDLCPEELRRDLSGDGALSLAEVEGAIAELLPVHTR